MTQTRDVIISENTFTQNAEQNEGLPSQNTRHALLIMADNIEGDGFREKRRIMKKIIPMGIRYVRTCVKRINNVTYIKIDFPTHEHMEKMATLFDTKNIKYEVNDYKKR